MLIGAFLVNPDLYLMDEPLSGLDKESLENLITIIEEKRVEGVIFIGLRRDDKYIEDIKNIKVPVVVIDQRIESFNIAYISSDNKLGVKKALNHLIENGHKKIGILKEN